jgi:hypothetical protein
VDDDAVRIVGGQRERQGRGVGVRQAAVEVVLDDEGTRCPGDAEHGGAVAVVHNTRRRLSSRSRRPARCEVGAWRVRGDIEPVDVQELAAAAGPR